MMKVPSNIGLSARSTRQRKDARLGQRFSELLKQIGDGMGGSILFACQDWANTKAAYRFFANGRLEEAESSAVTSSSRALRWF